MIQQKKKEILRAKNMSADEDELGKKKRHAFLDLLLIGQLKGSGFTDQDILDEVNTFLFAVRSNLLKFSTENYVFFF